MKVLTWSVTTGAEGQRICRAPDGGWAELRERQRPLLPFRQLVDRRVEDLRAAGIRELAPERARRVVTVEGELGAIATTAGSCEGEPIEHSLAVSYADDFQVEIDARASRADQRDGVRAAVRELVSRFPVGLGELRYRRYLYQPPAGWHGVSRGLVT